MAGKRKESEESDGIYVVESSFRDIDNFDLTHEVGDDVSHFDPERLKGLTDRGHVKYTVFPGKSAE